MGLLLERGEDVGSAGKMDATPGPDDRPFGAGNQPRCPGDRIPVGDGPVEGHLAQRLVAPGACRPGRFHDVDRRQKNGRTGASAGRLTEGHVDVVVDAPGVLDPAHPLGAALEQFEMIELLEGIAVPPQGRRVLDQGHHRGGRRQCLGQPGDEQCRRRSVLCGHDAGLAGNPGVGIGHHGAGVLGAIGHLADAELRGRQEEGRGNRLAEDGVDPVAGEGGGEDPGSRKVAVGHGGRWSRPSTVLVATPPTSRLVTASSSMRAQETILLARPISTPCSALTWTRAPGSGDTMRWRTR